MGASNPVSSLAVTMISFSGSAGSRKRSSSRPPRHRVIGRRLRVLRVVLLVCRLHRHHDVRGLRRQQLVQLGLEQQAALTVEGDDLALEAVGLHLGLEVLDDVLAHLADALGRLHQHGHLGGGLGQVVLVQIRQAAGQVLVGGVQRGLVDVQVDQPGLEVQLQRGAVADRLLEAVAAHVALLVLVGTEGVEGVAVGAVDRRARQAEQKRIGQGLAHLAAQVAFLGAVGLVHQRDDVAARVQRPAGLAELEDRRDDDLAHVLRQQLLQLLPGVGLLQVGDVRPGEGAGDLAVEIDPVHHDQHGGVLQAACMRSFCAANTISSDLPEPWKCQIRPFLG